MLRASGLRLFHPLLHRWRLSPTEELFPTASRELKLPELAVGEKRGKAESPQGFDDRIPEPLPDPIPCGFMGLGPPWVQTFDYFPAESALSDYRNSGSRFACAVFSEIGSRYIRLQKFLYQQLRDSGEFYAL